MSPPRVSSFAGLLGWAESLLLSSFADMLGSLARLPDGDRCRIGEVLTTITSGQELDLDRFGSAREARIAALESDEELDDYTYRVAGCVGEFWTKMCRAHLFPTVPLDEALLFADGVRFGKGLQLVNILRDLPVDLRKGRCYLPTAGLAANGLTPQDLLNPAAEPRMREFYRSLLDIARAHLAAGWDYTNALPRRCLRVRLACAWPVLIGTRTLSLLCAGNVLDPNHRIKVNRAEVRKLMVRSLIWHPIPSRWHRLFDEAGRSLQA